MRECHSLGVRLAAVALCLVWAAALPGIGPANGQRTEALAAADSRAGQRDWTDIGSLNRFSSSVFSVHVPAVFRACVFCEGAPTLVSPADGAVLDTLIPLFVLDNGPRPVATRVGFVVANDAGFEHTVVSSETDVRPGAFSIRLGDNLAANTTYYWRARFTCGRLDGPYSPVHGFTTGSGGIVLPAPSLLDPANESTVTSGVVTLRCSLVSGAVEYQFATRRVGGAGWRVWRLAVAQFEFNVSAGASYDRYVKVRNDYAWSDNSATWRFTVAEEGARRGRDTTRDD